MQNMKGFVTLATGDERYFELAANLLQSYCYFTKKKYPFAIIADKENKYTQMFDKVVLIQEAEGSYMDKIRLLNTCPFEENIFIDADCLAYKDLNEYWECFQDADDFSCFGSVLPLDSKDGLFKQEDVAEYKNKIKFVTHLHGVIYYIRKSKLCEELLTTCFDIIKNYDHYYFEYFEKPADESVFALAMALHNCRPVERRARYYVFLPVAKYIKQDIAKGYLAYETFKDGLTENGMLIHWANINTKRSTYKVEAYKLKRMIKKEPINKVIICSSDFIWSIEDFACDVRKNLCAMQSWMKSKIYKMLKKF